MGKKNKKAGKGKEKTERKTAKAEEKRARRESKKVSEEDDIDAILRSIQKEEAKKKEVHVEDNVPAPSPRSNCSLNINPLKESELILYGGEFYNGNKTFVYGDLYRYDVEKNEWKLISSPNSPPPRSAHQAVAWKERLYTFGGEFTSPNQERFHHYKDFWSLDLKTNQWEQLLLKGCPSPRSGHRMVLYKHRIILFGGFYDTLREVRLFYRTITSTKFILFNKMGYTDLAVSDGRYLNDLYVFDLDMYKWQEIKPKPGCLWPSARSGFQLFVYQDEIFLYGGYYKEMVSDKNSSEKGVVHSDMWSLDPRTWEWSKVKKGGMPPGPRAGFSMCVHKKRAVLFGGVVDMEVEGDVLVSLFLNELYGFQMDCHRWYPLELRKGKPSKDKSKGSKKQETEDSYSMDHEEAEIGLEPLPGVKDGDLGKPGYAVDVKKISDAVKEDLKIDGNTVLESSDGKSQDKSISSDLQALKPCGRINACVVAGKDMLYLYGGMMEVKDREITLDDLYTLNLSKLDEWRCIIPAAVSEWLEVSEEEEEDEDENESESDNGTDSDVSNDDNLEVDSANTAMDVENAVALLKGEKRNLRRKEKRARIEQIRATLGLSDLQRTPLPGESLRDFYKRTNTYWQVAAYEHTQHTGKELRKDGFDLAEARFKELKPILDELAILEAEQKAEEDVGEGSSKRGEGRSKKRDNNKNSKRRT